MLRHYTTASEPVAVWKSQKLQAQGKVRFIGFSTHGPTDIIVQAIATNQFDYVNLHWYYINQLNWPAIEAASRQDMGCLSLALLIKVGCTKPPQKLIICTLLVQSCLIFCLSHPQVHTLSVGASRPQNFDQHLRLYNCWKTQMRFCRRFWHS